MSTSQDTNSESRSPKVYTLSPGHSVSIPIDDLVACAEEQNTKKMSTPQNTRETHGSVDARESLANQVQHDIDFAKTLSERFLCHILKHKSLEEWIHISITNTRKALNMYNDLTAMEDIKKINPRSGLKAIFNRKHHEPSIDACGKNLKTCHSSLLAAITILSQFELVDIANEIAASKDRAKNRACSMPPRALKPKA
ncbi:hypothetical protein FACUT_3704 [Fusarium acutatum]|uniref:Uncharacterized protein n=1 Tax=Fusarium acutatum TaxID=78861 RepID=A0A8H4JYH6_9HYPO|nr:hypothetical protein FACUT_3704 [Fusarium acutatum]